MGFYFCVRQDVLPGNCHFHLAHSVLSCPFSFFFCVYWYFGESPEYLLHQSSRAAVRGELGMSAVKARCLGLLEFYKIFLRAQSKLEVLMIFSCFFLMTS